MDKAVLLNLLEGIDACAYAIIDTTTEPAKGVTKVTTGKRVLLFTNKNGSGYDALVRQRLIAAGKNPDNFELRDLTWGTRRPGTPLLEHKGKTFLQCIQLVDGQAKYYFLGAEANPDNLGLRERRRTNQGLDPSEEVIVCAYDIANIDKIVLLGDVPKMTRGQNIVPVSN